MITNFKIFENNIKHDIKIGNYIYNDVHNFIGKVTKILENSVYAINKEKTLELEIYFFQITHFAKSKKELEALINAEKYNL